MSITWTARHERMLRKFMEWTLGRCRNRTLTEFQKLVRLRAIEPDGLVSCVTCDWRGEASACDAGHFLSRRFSATCFDERNCHPQCKHCNRHQNGNLAAYRAFMVRTYGVQVVEELTQQSRQVKQWTKHELVEMRVQFMDACKQAAKR